MNERRYIRVNVEEFYEETHHLTTEQFRVWMRLLLIRGARNPGGRIPKGMACNVLVPFVEEGKGRP